MELSIDEQRKLTEWLEECNHLFRGGSCQLCGASFSRKNILDFDEWPTIGRLIEKLPHGMMLYKTVDTRVCILPDIKGEYKEDSYQLAICKAVIAYLDKK